MTLNVASLNNLYHFVASGQLTVVKAGSELVSQFCEIYRQLWQFSKGYPDDLFLGKTVRFVNRLRYRLLTTPLPLNHPYLIDNDSAGTVLRDISHISLSYGELKEPVETLIRLLNALRLRPENPLWEAVQEDVRADLGMKVGFVIGKASLIAAVRELLGRESLRQPLVMTDEDLRGFEILEKLYVFGPARWHREFVFFAPRAYDIRVVRYAHITDRPPERTVFINLLTTFSPPLFTDVDASSVGEDDPAPSQDMKWIRQRAAGFGKDLPSQQDASDHLDARVLVLEQEWAVLVPALEGASELVVDLREDAESLVYRVQTRSLEPGLAILLRTEGGGDLVVPVADRFMGDEAQELRREQQWWKTQLRAFVEKNGWISVVEQLKAAGSTIASRANLRNWMSSRSIRTHQRRDFEAIFTVIGIVQRADEYWDMMASIDKAHRYAGLQIRKQLLRQMKNADLSQLQIEGRQDFTLPGEVGGGSLAAIRILDVLLEAVEASGSTLHKLFPV